MTHRTINEYIVGFPPKVQALLRKVRATVRNHIGFYPPVRGDAKLRKAVAPYAGPKGNLRFPLDEPIPYALITRIVKARIRENRERMKARRRKRRPSGAA
jgi:uncharacterized protein YdhG (YjbR/CyaY superfamily)